MSQVLEALESAAEVGDGSISALECARRGDSRSTPTKRRISGAKAVIIAFLESVPPEMSAVEMLCELEDAN